ncbi:MAG: gamma-glutamyltransferase [Acidobacteria bacterium]|nr:gamma-glutamyltransferase [Acidobacteriota bacterium]MDP7338713.1 gamma-glutamyltransferase [Vicinamibacterales bacterium]MDP7477890.1 gamma-glutamyltransferase [Vicinamibacterales bacterium]HJN44622.1 gamma-glutamyltransferase [Vicinamibacterales bacterium]|tara:strand:- start:16 stop:1737 length:1722 start_codon:yes stop_codon:yes gene_type:complete
MLVRSASHRVAQALMVVSAIAVGVGTVAGQDRSSNRDGEALGHGYSRPARSPHGSRSEVIAPYGMVAASQPLAAQVGIDILKAGGNAIDAAVAVNAVLGLVEPHMNGVGGDLFAIVWDAETEQLYGLNATGRAPYEINRQVFERQGLERVPGTGPLTWTVPGAVDGWAQLLERFGTMSFADVLAPAIAYGRDGFPVSEVIQGQWAGSERTLAEWPTSAATYLPNGRPPALGELFKNPGLVRTYEAIAQGGRDAFYKGEIARKIVAFSESNGGYFTMRDFEDHSSMWVDPVTSSYRGYDIWEIPPNSSGIVALMMLNILEGYDMASLGHNSAAAIHRIVEAKKLAFADRDRYVADPNANALPVTELISKAYAEERRALIDPSRASQTVNAGDPTDTVYLTVVDKDRNAISLIESIFGGFGSKVVPADLGFALQNRGSGFSLEPGHLNSLEPHKRSLHTNMPAFVTKDGKPFLSFGVMGGDMQPQGHTQVLSNIIDFGMNLQEAGDAARVRHGGSVQVEPGVTDAVIAELERMGHRVRRAGGGGMGGYQAIMINPETGMLHAGTDPRKDGAAIGY